MTNKGQFVFAELNNPVVVASIIPFQCSRTVRLIQPLQLLSGQGTHNQQDLDQFILEVREKAQCELFEVVLSVGSLLSFNSYLTLLKFKFIIQSITIYNFRLVQFVRV